MKVKAIKYKLEDQPGFISFEFKDMRGKLWTITDKLPVVGLAYPEDETNVPFEFRVSSKILDSYLDNDGKEVLRIEFFYHIESDDGETEFEIFAEDYHS